MGIYHGINKYIEMLECGEIKEGDMVVVRNGKADYRYVVQEDGCLDLPRSQESIRVLGRSKPVSPIEMIGKRTIWETEKR